MIVIMGEGVGGRPWDAIKNTLLLMFQLNEEFGCAGVEYMSRCFKVLRDRLKLINQEVDCNGREYQESRL